MTDTLSTTWIAFGNSQCIAQGLPREVASQMKTFSDTHPEARLIAFDTASSQTVELDLRGTVSAVLRRLPAPTALPAAALTNSAAEAPRLPGRPKLGVVAREVTLLPRHWEWLASQPGGASVALRKLVEQARKAQRGADRVRLAREVAYRFMSTMASGEPGFEEASRALFAGDLAAWQTHTAAWPADVRSHALHLAQAAEPRPEDGAIA